MTLSEISTLRTWNQQIECSRFNSAKELIEWFGAIQAQDFQMAKWAVGLRISNSTEEIINKAYNAGEILRTHLLRPTWHFVSADDIYWMLDLTSSQIKKQMKSNNKRLELTDKILNKGTEIIENLLVINDFLSRNEISNALQLEKISTDENRLSHILMQAELDGIICSGPIINKILTYSLLEKRVTLKRKLAREEALAELAKKYFRSHGPATMKDFVWWSGLSTTDARNALKMVEPFFVSETIDSETYWFTHSDSVTIKNSNVHLLPAFDEFLISYTNRNAALKLVDNRKTISDNGIFRPIIIINGQVCGIWKRETKKDNVLIQTNLFQEQTLETKSLIENEVNRYASFINRPTQYTEKNIF